MADEQPWFQNRRGRWMVLLYLVFTLVGVGVSVGWGGGLSVSLPDSVTIPTYVYLYGFLGALAYAFTSLLTEFDKPARDLLQVGLRIPAALLLATGVYLLAAFFVSDPSTRVVAGLSFIVGLYVKLSLEALGSLARRLYGIGTQDGPGEPAAAETGTEDGDADDDEEAPGVTSPADSPDGDTDGDPEARDGPPGPNGPVPPEPDR